MKEVLSQEVTFELSPDTKLPYTVQVMEDLKTRDTRIKGAVSAKALSEENPWILGQHAWGPLSKWETGMPWDSRGGGLIQMANTRLNPELPLFSNYQNVLTGSSSSLLPSSRGGFSFSHHVEVIPWNPPPYEPPRCQCLSFHLMLSGDEKWHGFWLDGKTNEKGMPG